jgi:hypothetical protein
MYVKYKTVARSRNRCYSGRAMVIIYLSLCLRARVLCVQVRGLVFVRARV